MSSFPKKLNRRDFLRKTAELSALLAYYGSGTAHAQKLLAPQGRADGSSPDNTPYDYIVVGSGAGGGPVACNLARAGFRVLLLEAGGDYHGDKYNIPILHAASSETPEMAWNFYVKHYSELSRGLQDSKFNAQTQGVLYPRAATIGGCTAHNAMITLYPDNSDWNKIAKLTGDRSWEANEMRQYFEQVENATYLTSQEAKITRRGKFGWLSTETTPIDLLFQDKQLLNILLATFKASDMGDDTIKRVLTQTLNLDLDPNDWRYVQNKTDGIFRIPKATKNGARNGTREYIVATKQQYPQNLFIRTHSLASQILFSDRVKNRAIGIEYLAQAHVYKADPNASATVNRSGVTKRVYAKKEVILAGGAFNTPQLLMLSGIGDPAELARFKIGTRIALPGVGKNLQDRYEVGVTTELPHDLDLIKDCTFLNGNDPCLDDYYQNPAKSVYGSNGVSFALIGKSSAKQESPDLCIFGLPGAFHGYFDGYSQSVIQKDKFTWAILKGHTKNTAGTVTLRSADPTDTPEINFRYFDEGNDAAGEDLDAVLGAMKRVRKINTKLRHTKELWPGAEVQSDDEIRQYVKRNAWGHHASCTNKMGPVTDPFSVVASDFRVHKTQGLRIVDASIFPNIPGLFIAAPIYMAAEKASQVIIKSTL